jgi:hypothetical protein
MGERTKSERDRIAHVVGVDADGRPRVRRICDGDVVTASAAFTEPAIDWSRCEGLRVLLVVADGMTIVTQLLDAPPRDALRHALPVVRDEDGVLTITAEQEIVLRCGAAKIALRADGRVTILGGYVLSRSTGPNKIRGGSVHIN